jgi:hypothetical protein
MVFLRVVYGTGTSTTSRLGITGGRGVPKKLSRLATAGTAARLSLLSAINRLIRGLAIF